MATPLRTTMNRAEHLSAVEKPVPYRFMKRALDVVGSVVALVMLAPVFLAVALLVKMTSEGPILFRQKRLGKNGKQFTCLKFRTMVVNAEEVLKQRPDLMAAFQKDFKIKDDPRITPIGNFLRRTSLDELPQFYNVLSGDMSLIGPRPIVPKELEKYHIYGQKLLSVKPGLSGMWQASGRSDTSYEERIALDMEYVDQCCLALDIKLIWMTIVSVVRGRGAY